MLIIDSTNDGRFFVHTASGLTYVCDGCGHTSRDRILMSQASDDSDPYPIGYTYCHACAPWSPLTIHEGLVAAQKAAIKCIQVSVAELVARLDAAIAKAKAEARS